MMGAPGLAFETWDPPRDPGTPNWRTLTSRKPSVRMPLDRILTHTLKPDGMCVRTRVRRHLRRGSQVSKARPPDFPVRRAGQDRVCAFLHGKAHRVRGTH